MNKAANILHTMLNIERQVAHVLTTTMDVIDGAELCRKGSAEQRERFYQQRQMLQLTITEVEDILERMRQVVKATPKLWLGDTALAWSKSTDSIRQAKALVEYSYTECP